jgi:hypothetical protein
MAVTKFRSAEEMNATPVAGGPTDDFGRFLRHCARFRLIAPRSYPCGVFKFRDLSEAQAARARDSLKHTDARMTGSISNGRAAGPQRLSPGKK